MKDKKINRINVTRPSLPDFEEYVNEIKPLWKSRILTNMGEKHREFKKKLVEYLEVENLRLFLNGHFALESIIEAMELKGEVITTPFTFASTIHSIVRKGLKPVFCDINPIDYTIDVGKIESLITENTSGILPVHVYGNVCEVEAIDKIAEKYSLKVIYDGAHAFGVKYKGRGIGSFGDASMFSFHATKLFHTIEGGAVAYRDSNLSSILDKIKNFGITGKESIEYAGGNGKMNEFQAAMGICNLRYIDDEVSARKFLVERYRENLESIEGIKIYNHDSNVKPNYGYFPVVFDGFKKDRNQIYEELKKENIYSRKYFYPLGNTYDCYKDIYDVDETPIAKYIADRVLTLPLFRGLEIEDIDRISKIIKR